MSSGSDSDNGDDIEEDVTVNQSFVGGIFNWLTGSKDQAKGTQSTPKKRSIETICDCNRGSDDKEKLEKSSKHEAKRTRYAVSPTPPSTVVNDAYPSTSSRATPTKFKPDLILPAIDREGVSLESKVCLDDVNDKGKILTKHLPTAKKNVRFVSPVTTSAPFATSQPGGTEREVASRPHSQTKTEQSMNVEGMRDYGTVKINSTITVEDVRQHLAHSTMMTAVPLNPATNTSETDQIIIIDDTTARVMAAEKPSNFVTASGSTTKATIHELTRTPGKKWGKLLSLFTSHPDVELTADYVTVGRHWRCIVQLLDPNVSRLFCRIINDGGEVNIESLSRNGKLYVNSDHIGPYTTRRINVGDKVSIVASSSFSYVYTDETERDEETVAGVTSGQQGNVSLSHTLESIAGAIVDHRKHHMSSPESSSTRLPTSTDAMHPRGTSSSLSYKYPVSTEVQDIRHMQSTQIAAQRKMVQAQAMAMARANAACAGTGHSVSDESVSAKTVAADQADQEELYRRTHKALDVIKELWIDHFRAKMIHPSTIQDVSFADFPYYIDPLFMEQLIQSVYIYLKHPDFVAHTEGLSTLNRGVSLTGPPGTSKFQEKVVRALASHMGCNLLVIDPMDIQPSALKVEARKLPNLNQLHGYRRRLKERYRKTIQSGASTLAGELGTQGDFAKDLEAGTRTRRNEGMPQAFRDDLKTGVTAKDAYTDALLNAKKIKEKTVASVPATTRLSPADTHIAREVDENKSMDALVVGAFSGEADDDASVDSNSTSVAQATELVAPDSDAVAMITDDSTGVAEGEREAEGIAEKRETLERLYKKYKRFKVFNHYAWKLPKHVSDKESSAAWEELFSSLGLKGLEVGEGSSNAITEDNGESVDVSAMDIERQGKLEDSMDVFVQLWENYIHREYLKLADGKKGNSKTKVADSEALAQEPSFDDIIMNDLMNNDISLIDIKSNVTKSVKIGGVEINLDLDLLDLDEESLGGTLGPGGNLDISNDLFVDMEVDASMAEMKALNAKINALESLLSDGEGVDDSDMDSDLADHIDTPNALSSLSRTGKYGTGIFNNMADVSNRFYGREPSKSGGESKKSSGGAHRHTRTCINAHAHGLVGVGVSEKMSPFDDDLKGFVFTDEKKLNDRRESETCSISTTKAVLNITDGVQTRTPLSVAVKTDTNESDTVTHKDVDMREKDTNAVSASKYKNLMSALPAILTLKATLAELRAYQTFYKGDQVRYKAGPSETSVSDRSTATHSHRHISRGLPVASARALPVEYRQWFQPSYPKKAKLTSSGKIVPAGTSRSGATVPRANPLPPNNARGEVVRTFPGSPNIGVKFTNKYPGCINIGNIPNCFFVSRNNLSSAGTLPLNHLDLIAITTLFEACERDAPTILFIKAQHDGQPNTLLSDRKKLNHFTEEMAKLKKPVVVITENVEEPDESSEPSSSPPEPFSMAALGAKEQPSMRNMMKYITGGQPVTMYIREGLPASSPLKTRLAKVPSLRMTPLTIKPPMEAKQLRKWTAQITADQRQTTIGTNIRTLNSVLVRNAIKVEIKNREALQELFRIEPMLEDTALTPAQADSIVGWAISHHLRMANNTPIRTRTPALEKEAVGRDSRVSINMDVSEQNTWSPSKPTAKQPSRVAKSSLRACTTANARKRATRASKRKVTHKSHELKRVALHVDGTETDARFAIIEPKESITVVPTGSSRTEIVITGASPEPTSTPNVAPAPAPVPTPTPNLAPTPAPVPTPTPKTGCLTLSLLSLQHAILMYGAFNEAKDSHKTFTDSIKTDNAFEKTLLSNVIAANKIGVSFEDIGALSKVKKTLYELVILPLRRPELFTRGNLIKPMKGILLFGPPGTGKTLLAKAVATQSGANFLNISVSSITSKWMGEGEKYAKLYVVLFSTSKRLAKIVNTLFGASPRN
eukprot:CFRG3516T1